MRLDEPAWWYREPPTGMATLLQPVAALYGWAATARYRRATPYRSRLPVICVGNFTAGGTGKTPLVLYLCERLKAAGHEPVALTRGYGGRLSGPYWVNAKSDVARSLEALAEMEHKRGLAGAAGREIADADDRQLRPVRRHAPVMRDGEPAIEHCQGL